MDDQSNLSQRGRQMYALIGKFRAFRTPIPGDSGHEFRFNSDSDSGLIPDSFALKTGIIF